MFLARRRFNPRGNYWGQFRRPDTIGCVSVRPRTSANREVPNFRALALAGRIGFGHDVDLTQDLKPELTRDVSHTSKCNSTDTLRSDAIQKACTKLDASIETGGS